MRKPISRRSENEQTSVGGLSMPDLTSAVLMTPTIQPEQSGFEQVSSEHAHNFNKINIYPNSHQDTAQIQRVTQTPPNPPESTTETHLEPTAESPLDEFATLADDRLPQTEAIKFAKSFSDIPIFDTKQMDHGAITAHSQPSLGGFIQRKAHDENGVEAGAESAIATASSSNGTSLPETLMRKFETSLGADLSNVRVHTNAESAVAASSVGARAYTLGQDIHFGARQYDPISETGQHLLAHEVAHTVQQNNMPAAPQFKLEVSKPGDSLEVEADRAADAMMVGTPTAVSNTNSIIQRDPLPPINLFGGPQGSTQPPQGPSLFAPNADKNGVPYDIPTTDFRANLRSEFPPLNAAMPTASIGDPGPIPGWKTMTPERVSNFGPFETRTPPQPYIVHDGLHSAMAVQAWDEYKQFLREVTGVWNDQVSPKMNTYAQQKGGDPELQKLVDETKRDYNMASIKQGGGTIGQQAQQQQIQPGKTTQQVVDGVKAGGQGLLDGAKTSGAQPDNSTVGTPVKDKVDKLNIAREQTKASVDKLAGTGKQIDGAKTHLDAAKLKNDEVIAAAAAKDQPPEAMVKAQEAAKKVNPSLGQLVVTLVKYREPLTKLKDAATSGAKAAEGDPKAALEAVMALVAIANWDTLQKQAEEMKLFVVATPELKEVTAAGDAVIGLAQVAKGFVTELEANIKSEKKAYEALAAELEKSGNWKGNDPADGKRAADALRAIPVVDRVLRVLRELRGALPRVPSGGTRAAQGYTLATQGVGAPGAAELYTVASWIGSSSETIGGEISTWEGVQGQLQAVASSLGVK